jgi:hypothetical protein
VDEIFEIDINTCLCVNGLLFMSKQMEELYHSDRNSLEFLGFYYQLSELNIFYEFLPQNFVQIGCFCQVPPVFTSK